MKKKGIAEIILFLVGTGTALFLGKDYFSVYGFMNDYNLQNFAGLQIEPASLFWNILWERMKLFFIILIFSATPGRKLILPALKSLFSLSMGFFSSICFMRMGWLGGLVLFSAVVPHGIFYVLLLWGILGVEPVKTFDNRRMIKMRIKRILAGLVLIINGCLIEATVSTRILQMVLKVHFSNVIN